MPSWCSDLDIGPSIGPDERVSEDQAGRKLPKALMDCIILTVIQQSTTSTITAMKSDMQSRDPDARLLTKFDNVVTMYILIPVAFKLWR